MSKSTAERQRAYQSRRLDRGFQRVNILVECETSVRLGRLCRHMKLPQREVLAIALENVELALLADLNDAARREYFAVTQ